MYKPTYTCTHERHPTIEELACWLSIFAGTAREVGGWGRDPFSRNFMKPTPCRKWYLTTGRRFH